MKKFLIGLVSGLLLAVLVVFVLVFAALRFGEGRPTIQQGSTLVFNLRGSVPEAPPMRLPIPVLEAKQPPTVREIWLLLHRAASDARIRAVVFAPTQIGRASCRERV